MSIGSVANSPYSSASTSFWGLDLDMADNDAQKTAKNDAQKAGSAAKASAASTTARSNNPYGASSTGTTPEALAAALSNAMDGLGLSAQDKVSFQTLMEYRDKLQTQFTDKTRAGLLAQGVDKDVQFRLVSGSNGSGVRVVTDSPDKAKIEKYFADNPNMVQAFEQIQSLTKMEDVRKSQHIDIKAIRDRIQMQSMTAWFANTNNSFMAFAGESAAMYSGVSAIA